MSRPSTANKFINQSELSWLIGNPDYLMEQAQALSSHAQKDKVDILYLLEKVDNINRQAKKIKAHFNLK